MAKKWYVMEIVDGYSYMLKGFNYKKGALNYARKICDPVVNQRDEDDPFDNSRFLEIYEYKNYTSFGVVSYPNQLMVMDGEIVPECIVKQIIVTNNKDLFKKD